MNVTPELDARFRAAAEGSGLVDARYDIVDSPVGELFVAVTERGLCRVGYRLDAADDELARSFGRRVLRARLDSVRREPAEAAADHDDVRCAVCHGHSVVYARSVAPSSCRSARLRSRPPA